LTADSDDSVGRCPARLDDRAAADWNQADLNGADLNQVGLNQFDLNQAALNRVVVVRQVSQVRLTVDSDAWAGFRRARLGDRGVAGSNQVDLNQVYLNPVDLNPDGLNPVDSNRAAEVRQVWSVARTADSEASVCFHPAPSSADPVGADFDSACSASRAYPGARTDDSGQASRERGWRVSRALLVCLA
jgi:uncharacterized protein YjbI with pentapeptide repeats